MNFKAQAKELVAKMTLEEKMSQMRYDAPAIQRLGIPAYNWWNEGLHGVARAGRATVFPQAIGMAASFNTPLMEQVATAISDEARANYNEYRKLGDTERYEGLTYWSPNINIFRDPRWGRGHETYGEDPYLTGRMGTAFVRGLQGDPDYQYRKLDACIKHFAVHSGPESLRHSFDAVVSEKDLWETYLWAFRYCIDHAKPASVMGAYNRTNGEPCCGSKTLLQDILREKWGFDGYVVSDCGAIRDFHKYHQITANEEESAALAVNNGCDLNCGKVYQVLMDAWESDLITEETIDVCVERLMEARLRLGMFADDCKYDRIPYSVVECDAHRALNRKMAQDCVVLLKNNGVLPLKREQRVAVIGPNSDSKMVLLGNYNGTPSKYYTFLRGMQQYGDPTFAEGCHLYKENFPDHGFSIRSAIVAANHADVIVMFMGIDPSMEGEQGDRYNVDASGDKVTLELPVSQQKLYEAMKELGKPIVFVNVSGSCLNLRDQKENCDAVIQCFYPGAEGGLALADILYGTVSPSGRLPVTFYESLADLPPFEDYSMENRTYKFFKGTPVFEFGHGLTYSEIEERWLDENTVELTNKGELDTAYSVLKYEYIPHKNLCDFQKVFLRKGEKLTVVFDGKDE